MAKIIRGVAQDPEAPQPDPAMRPEAVQADPVPVEAIAPSPRDLPDPSPRGGRSPSLAMPGAVQASDGSVSYVVGQPELREGVDQPRTAVAEDALVPGVRLTAAPGTYVHKACGQRNAPIADRPLLANGAWCETCHNYFGLAEFTELAPAPGLTPVEPTDAG